MVTECTRTGAGGRTGPAYPLVLRVLSKEFQRPCRVALHVLLDGIAARRVGGLAGGEECHPCGRTVQRATPPGPLRCLWRPVNTSPARGGTSAGRWHQTSRGGQKGRTKTPPLLTRPQDGPRRTHLVGGRARSPRCCPSAGGTRLQCWEETLSRRVPRGRGGRGVAGSAAPVEHRQMDSFSTTRIRAPPDLVFYVSF